MAKTVDMNQTAHQSELRQATVMFADISGFTAMSEKLNPEEVTAIMNDCFGILSSVITGCGGTIDKYIGDCIMSVFGVPKAIERSPQRAITAALAMREALGRFNADRRLTIPLDIHIGINSGEVLAGEVGGDEKSDFTVMGDTVNLASRLEDASATGQILVGPMTFRYARTEFRFNPLKPITVKGKAEPVQVYEVLGKAKRSAAQDGEAAGESGNRTIQSVMVGREKERDRLDLQIMKVINGEGSVVSLIGEAGVGKSRLSAEVLGEKFMDRVTLLEGRALSTGRNLSYYPIIGIIRNWVSIGEDDGEETAFAKLEAAVRTVSPEQADEIVPFVATLMGFTLKGRYAERMKNVSGDSLAKLITKQLRDLIIASSKFKPLIFVVEDLHWADQSTLEMLQALVPVAAEHPVMFMFNFRPGYAETSEAFHRELKEQFSKLCADIVLSALTAEESSALTKNLLRMEGLPAKIIRQIIERSGGNPFFIEEVVRSFIDFGYVKRTEYGFTAISDLESVSVPNSINEVIMARVDSLDTGMRELLRVASVIGRNFFHRILAEITETTDTMEESLEVLKQLQFIRERTRMDEIEYLFKHALAQEAVYNSVLIRERKKLHLAVAGAIKSIFADRLPEFYGVLAAHFMQGEDFGKAEEYLEKAGEAAMNASASSEALTFYEQAVRVYRETQGEKASPERLAEFEVNIALAYRRKGEYTAVIEHYTKVLEYLGQIKGKIGQVIDVGMGALAIIRWLYLPPRRRTRELTQRDSLILKAFHGIAWANTMIYPQLCVVYSMRLFRRGLKIGSTLFRMWPELIFDLSNVLAGVGLLGNVAERIRSRGCAIIGGNDVHAFYLNAGSELWANFTYGKEEFIFRPDLFRYFVGVGDFERANLNGCYLHMMLLFRNRFTEAEEFLEEYKKAAEDYQNLALLILYYEGLTLRAFLRRDYGKSIETARMLVDLADRLGQQTVRKLYLAHLSRSIIDSGDLTAAGPMIEEIRRLLEKKEILFPIQAAPPNIAVIAYFCAKADAENNGKLPPEMIQESRGYIGPMMKASGRFNQRYPEACRFAGIWYWQAGRVRKALQWWKRGLAKAVELEMKPEEARIYREIGRRISEQGSRVRRVDGRTAEQYLLLARDGFGELGLDIDRLEIEEMAARLKRL